MTFLELARKRQSTREFLDRPVEREKIERCVEAARLAPSACNSQPWKFIVIDEPDLRTAVARRLTSPVFRINAFAAQAPLLIAVVTEPSTLTARLGAMLKDKPYHLMDLGIAVEHFCLQAVEEGLGTCIMGWFDEAGVKRLLEVRQSAVRQRPVSGLQRASKLFATPLEQGIINVGRRATVKVFCHLAELRSVVALDAVAAQTVHAESIG